MKTTALDEIGYLLTNQKYYTNPTREKSLFEFLNIDRTVFVFIERIRSEEELEKYERRLELEELGNLVPVFGDELYGLLRLYEQNDDKKIRENRRKGIDALCSALALRVNIGSRQYNKL